MTGTWYRGGRRCRAGGWAGAATAIQLVFACLLAVLGTAGLPAPAAAGLPGLGTAGLPDRAVAHSPATSPGHSPATSPARVLAQSPAHSLAHSPIGVIVSGDAVDAPATMKTYSGDAFWITADELAELKASKGATGPFGGLWATAKYSFCHDHGVPEYGYAVAAGIDLKRLLGAAGLSADQIAAVDRLTVSAADGYFMPLDPRPLRYVFVTPDAEPGDVVDPMLALYRDDAEAYVDLPDEADTPVDGTHPTLLYGQLMAAESNQCGFVKGAAKVALPTAVPGLVVDAPDAFSTDPSERQKTPFTLASLVTDGDVQRSYNVAGESYTCDGIDLASLLAKARGRMNPQDTISVVTSAGTVDSGIRVADVVAGAYLVAYYSENGQGEAVANQTQCMLYGEGLAIADVKELRIERQDQATASLRLTSPTVSQTKACRARGTKLALRATATRAPGAISAEPIVWRSSNAKVARVAASGTVTARKVGKAVITAKSGACTRRFTVVVLARHRPATKITLPRTRAMKVGATARAGARLYPAGATVTVTWRSSKAAVVKVDRAGTLKSVKRGKATITVRTSDGKTARCVVTVRKRWGARGGTCGSERGAAGCAAWVRAGCVAGSSA